MKSYPWQSHYPPSVPYTINPDRYPSIVSFIEESFRRYHDLPMCENMGKQMTYGEVDQLSKAFAAYLQNNASLQPGDRVAIQLPNLLQYPIALLGVLRAGMVVVNINPLYTHYEMAASLKDSQAKAIVVLANFAHNLEKVLAETSLQTVIITEVGDMLGGIKGLFTNLAVRHLKKLVPSYHLPQAVPFKRVLRDGRKAQFQRADVQGNQIAFLQYTGGTTGVSKGAILTHRNVVACIEQMATFMRVRLKEREEIVITPLPLYHVFSLVVNLMAMIKIGAKIVLITNPRDIPSFVKELRKHRFTTITGVNTLFKMLLEAPGFASLDFSGLKVALGGGIALQAAVAKQWKEVTGNSLIEGYGLTETCSAITCNVLEGTHQIGSVGVPTPSTIVKVVDDQNQEVPYGTAGELLVKGPQVMQGYWQQPQETAQVLEDGWLRTGDVAVMDKDGIITIVDRKKSMINVSGFNVYPNEIEAVVSDHPQVLEVGAIGVFDKDAKEVIKLFVVKKDPALTEEALIAYCRERLTNYKVPKYVEFKATLPKSNVGKILHRVLKEEAQQHIQQPPQTI